MRHGLSPDPAAPVSIEAEAPGNLRLARYIAIGEAACRDRSDELMSCHYQSSCEPVDVCGEIKWGAQNAPIGLPTSPMLQQLF